MHIEIVNTYSKCECIVVWSNDPRWVNRGKGYRVVDWLDCFAAIWDMDGFHPGSGCGRSQHPSPLELILILVFNQAT